MRLVPDRATLLGLIDSLILLTMAAKWLYLYSEDKLHFTTNSIGTSMGQDNSVHSIAEKPLKVRATFTSSPSDLTLYLGRITN